MIDVLGASLTVLVLHSIIIIIIIIISSSSSSWSYCSQARLQRTQIWWEAYSLVVQSTILAPPRLTAMQSLCESTQCRILPSKQHTSSLYIYLSLSLSVCLSVSVMWYTQQGRKSSHVVGSRVGSTCTTPAVVALTTWRRICRDDALNYVELTSSSSISKLPSFQAKQGFVWRRTAQRNGGRVRASVALICVQFVCIKRLLSTRPAVPHWEVSDRRRDIKQTLCNQWRTLRV